MANINVLLPPGATSSYAAHPVDQNVSTRLSNPNTIDKRIQEARLQDGMKRQLMQEFAMIDVNQDGIITRPELHQYFKEVKQILDEDMRYKIVDEIFDQIDLDDNGTIAIEEFIMKYIDTKNKLQERKEEVMRNIADHYRQQEEVKFKLQEAMQSERQFMTQMGIRSDSKLKVHIVDAQNLEDGQHQVKVWQHDSYAETNLRVGAAPIWNEAIVFDIKDPFQPVVIQLVNQQGELVLEQALDLNDQNIRDYSQQGEEIWAWQSWDDQGIGIETDAKLRLRCHFSYSDIARFEQLLRDWHDYINEDIEELELIQEYLQNLTTPFGFLKVMASEKQHELHDDDKEDLKEEKTGDTKYHKQEKLYEAQVDEKAKQIASQFGYRSVPWLGLAYFSLVVQFVLAMLTQIQRKDMVTITVVSLGFYMLSYPESTRRKQFRMLVGLIGLSIVQDVLWFILNRDTEDDEDDGGLERGVKSFARTLSFVSLVWRILVAIVFWKISLDFVRVIKQKNVDGDAVSLEQRVANIIDAHRNEMDASEQFN